MELQPSLLGSFQFLMVSLCAWLCYGFISQTWLLSNGRMLEWNPVSLQGVTIFPSSFVASSLPKWIGDNTDPKAGSAVWSCDSPKLRTAPCNKLPHQGRYFDVVSRWELEFACRSSDFRSLFQGLNLLWILTLSGILLAAHIQFACSVCLNNCIFFRPKLKKVGQTLHLFSIYY